MMYDADEGLKGEGERQICCNGRRGNSNLDRFRFERPLFSPNHLPHPPLPPFACSVDFELQLKSRATQARPRSPWRTRHLLKNRSLHPCLPDQTSNWRNYHPYLSLDHLNLETCFEACLPRHKTLLRWKPRQEVDAKRSELN